MLKIAMKLRSSIDEVLLEQGLAIEVKQVEGVEADYRLQVLLCHIFAASLSQHLEGQNLLLLGVKGHKLCIQDEVFNT